MLPYPQTGDLKKKKKEKKKGRWLQTLDFPPWEPHKEVQDTPGLSELYDRLCG